MNLLISNVQTKQSSCKYNTSQNSNAICDGVIKDTLLNTWALVNSLLVQMLKPRAFVSKETKLAIVPPNLIVRALPIQQSLG